jgi:hypothetical protein
LGQVKDKLVFGIAIPAIGIEFGDWKNYKCQHSTTASKGVART